MVVGACAACGTSDIRQVEPRLQPTPVDAPARETFIDEDLRLYVELFMNDCEARRTDCEEKLKLVEEIRLVEIPDLNKQDKEMVVGLCYLNFFSNKVHISKAVFSFGHKYVQTIMYHELGHCMYDLDHEKKDDMLMSAMMPDLTVLLQDWPQLLDDFFAAIQEQHGP